MWLGPLQGMPACNKLQRYSAATASSILKEHSMTNRLTALKAKCGIYKQLLSAPLRPHKAT